MASRRGGPARELRALGLRPNRRLSQSFLSAPRIADEMVRAAEIGPDDRVLEIGPGLGVLTRLLVEAAGSVVCVEVDTRLAEALSPALADPTNLQVVQGDVLAVDLAELVSEPYLVVASLPYNAASPILFKLAFHRPKPTRMVVMLQREVAHRLLRSTNAMTYLSAAFATVGTVRVVRRVPPGAFFPPPRVQSAIVRIDLGAEPAVTVDSLERFLGFLRDGFCQPRQQLHNSLARGLGVDLKAARAVCEVAGIDEKRRPAELSLEEWVALYERFGEGIGSCSGQNDRH